MLKFLQLYCSCCRFCFHLPMSNMYQVPFLFIYSMQFDLEHFCHTSQSRDTLLFTGPDTHVHGTHSLKFYNFLRCVSISLRTVNWFHRTVWLANKNGLLCCHLLLSRGGTQFYFLLCRFSVAYVPLPFRHNSSALEVRVCKFSQKNKK